MDLYPPTDNQTNVENVKKNCCCCFLVNSLSLDTDQSSFAFFFIHHAQLHLSEQSTQITHMLPSMVSSPDWPAAGCWIVMAVGNAKRRWIIPNLFKQDGDIV